MPEYFSPFDQDPAAGLASTTAPPVSTMPLVVPEAAGLADATAPMASTPPPMASPAGGPMASMPEGVGGSPPPEPNFQTAGGQSVFVPPPVVKPPIGVAGGATTPTAKPQAAGQAASRPAQGGVGDPRRKELKDLQAKIAGSQAATVGAYEGLEASDKERAKQLEETAKNVAVQRNAQNTVDAYHANQLVQHDQEATKRTGDELAAIQSASDKVANMKVDRNRLATKAGAPGAILAALGGMLSGFQGGFSGRGGNDFLDRLTSAIDKDVEDQEKAIGRARTDVQQRINNFGMLKAQLGDERQAKLAAKTLAYDDAQKRIQAAKEKMEGVEAKAAADKAIADIQLRKEQTIQQYAGGRKQEIQTQLSGEAAARAAAAKAENDEKWKQKEYDLKKLEAEGKANKDVVERDKTFVKGMGGYVGTEQQANQLNSAFDANDRGINSASRLLGLMKEGNSLTSDGGAMQTLANDITLAGAVQNQLGAISKDDAKLMPTSSDEVLDWIRTRQFGRLEEYLRISRAAPDRWRKNYMLRDLQGRDTRGERVQIAEENRPRPGSIPEGLEARGKVSGGG